jgi:predicted unusual protein kinase regulating ubiquinone biosynthesis (AarF/ABC1/UbiB family)
VLTGDFLEGVPLIDILTAVRTGNTKYLCDLAAWGYDLESIVRHLDWNMLNQVFVFGCFHADLHPANLIVLPGNAIGYVDFGIIGRLSDDMRASLTRYSWLLFQGDVEGAIKELTRWLVPTVAGDVAGARQALIRVHEIFLYQSAQNGDSVDHPYLQFAVGILTTMRQYDMVLSPGVVAYLRMHATLGMLRYQLAPKYDLSKHVRRFFGRLIRQQAVSVFDPRLMLNRAYSGSIQLRRGLEFIEYVEAQEPLIAALEGTLVGVGNSMTSLRRWAMRLIPASLAVGAALYVVLADPRDTRAALPKQIPYDWLKLGLLAILLVLIFSLVLQGLRLRRVEQQALTTPATGDATAPRRRGAR